MQQRHTINTIAVFSISLLFFFSNLTSVCLDTNEPPQAATIPLMVRHGEPTENHAPETPQQPQGPIEGDAGETYLFSTQTTDPDGDSLYYMIDWGDFSEETWVGPYDTGVEITFSHLWQQRGSYDVKVKAKDVHDAVSNWSEPVLVTIAGSYLTFGNISDGLGLTIEVKNIGENDAMNVTVSLQATQGFFIRINPTQFQIGLIPSGGSVEHKIRVRGFGIGLFSDLPKVTLTAQGSYAKTRGKQLEIRLLGLWVKKLGESWSADEAYKGYTLYSPMVSPKTFLINNSGGIVHSWESLYKPALSVYLLENGNLLRTAFPGFSPEFWGGGIGGRVERFDWNGTRLWSFEYSTSQYCLHHDIQMLPNGNILMIAWEYKSAEEAIAKGRNPTSLPQGKLWPDHLIEVHPTGPTDGEIVWEWHLWDHLIQDFDPTKENYGIVQDHPELVDINYGGRILADWTHMNSVDYNEEYDQILVSVLLFDELWVIDHSTTTQEAAGHTGGRYGKGGDLLYRWGNPLTYKRGDDTDRMLFNQHDAEWIRPGLPGAGHILIFNNGLDRPDGEYSSVDEITPPMEPDGTYRLTPGSTYEPDQSTWRYAAEQPTDFFAINLGSAQRLPNGNTLICDGPQGRFFEVTNEKEIVWEYENQIPDPIDHHVFKIHRYGPEYPGLRFLQ
jgi:Arylsulfotransferase (ASST)/PKD domain